MSQGNRHGDSYDLALKFLRGRASTMISRKQRSWLEDVINREGSLYDGVESVFADGLKDAQDRDIISIRRFNNGAACLQRHVPEDERPSS